jgi:hypothetical protein
LIRIPKEELESFTPETAAQEIALARIKEARKSGGLHDAKEIANRTEGQAPQAIDLTTNGNNINPLSNLTTEELRKLAQDK